MSTLVSTLTVGSYPQISTFNSAALIPAMQVLGTTDANNSTIGVARFDSTPAAAASQFVLARALSDTIAYTPVTANTVLGIFACEGSDGDKFVRSCSIRGVCDGTVSDNIAPGRWEFYTNSASGVSTLGLTINSIQQSIHALGTAALPSVTFAGRTTDGFFSQAANVVSLSTAGIERWRTTASGAVMISRNAAGMTGLVNSGGVFDIHAIDGGGVFVGLNAYGGATGIVGRTCGAGSMLAAPLASTANQLALYFSGRGCGSDGAYSTGDKAAIYLKAADAYGAANAGGMYIEFATTAAASTANGTVKMRLQASGGLTLGSAILATDPGAGALLISGAFKTNDTTASTSTTTGSGIFGGGIGVAGDVKSGGRVTEQGTFAAIHVHDASTAQSIPTGATYTKSTAFTDNGFSANCTPDATNDKITITKPGIYRVEGSFSFTCGTNNVVWRGSAFLGGTEQDQVHWERKVGTGTDIGNAGFTGLIDVTSANTDLDFRIRHDNVGSVDFTIVYANINVSYLGET